jgi:hypothetical protein
MPGLSPDQVRGLAAAIGLPISDEDLAEVAFRLNATLDRLTALDLAAGAERDQESADRAAPPER